MVRTKVNKQLLSNLVPEPEDNQEIEPNVGPEPDYEIESGMNNNNEEVNHDDEEYDVFRMLRELLEDF